MARLIDQPSSLHRPGARARVRPERDPAANGNDLIILVNDFVNGSSYRKLLKGMVMLTV